MDRETDRHMMKLIVTIFLMCLKMKFCKYNYYN
jgi:hypothetical protein